MESSDNRTSARLKPAPFSSPANSLSARSHPCPGQCLRAVGLRNASSGLHQRKKTRKPFLISCRVSRFPRKFGRKSKSYPNKIKKLLSLDQVHTVSKEVLPASPPFALPAGGLSTSRLLKF